MGEVRDQVKGWLDDAVLGSDATLDAIYRGEDAVNPADAIATMFRNLSALNQSVIALAEHVDDLRAAADGR